MIYRWLGIVQKQGRRPWVLAKRKQEEGGG